MPQPLFSVPTAESEPHSGKNRHAFLWQAGAMTDIHDPDWSTGSDSTTRTIDNGGLMAGTAGIRGRFWQTPDDSETINGGLPGPSDAHDLNDSTQVVG